MNEDRKERLLNLKKKNRLNQILPNILTSLIQIEQNFEQAHILPISEIDDMLMKIRTDNRETIIIKKTPQSNLKSIHQIFEKLSHHLNQKNYFSTSKLIKLWYAEINTTFLIDKFKEVIEVDGDLFIVHDKELKNGLWLDLSEEYWRKEEDVNYEWVYELKIWGKDWTSELIREL